MPSQNLSNNKLFKTFRKTELSLEFEIWSYFFKKESVSDNVGQPVLFYFYFNPNP